MNKMYFYSIMPLLEDEIGHIYAYNLALSKAIEKNGWNHFAFVPRSVKIKTLPSNWERKLPMDSWKKKRNLIRKIRICILNAFVYKKIFRQAARQNGIIFLEHFTLTHLLSLTFSAFFTKNKLNLWLLHRYLPSNRKKFIFRAIHALLGRFLGKDKVKLFTDSILLKRDLQKIFQQEVILLPIPHSHIRVKRTNKFSDPIFLWWPGGIIRKSKGLSEILQIAKKIRSSNIKLVLAESMKKYQLPLEHILFISDELSRNDYEFWMNKVDILLLPYDPLVYSHGTSGIFVEAISCGKIPFVKAGSWLAHELRRYDLQELIISWDLPEIIEVFLKSLCNRDIQKKVKQMQKDYIQYHCIDSFSKILEESAYNY